MYEVLIAHLRECAKLDPSNNTYAESANAIEELQQQVEHYHGCMNDWFEAAQEYKEQIPRWIPASERLPEEHNHYLVHIECKCDGELMSKWTQVAWFCEKFYWEHLHSEDVFKETVTHWMPLPEPPKEE